MSQEVPEPVATGAEATGPQPIGTGERPAAKLMSVRMLLASNPGFPEGSTTRGYEFLAPLSPDAQLDPEAFRAAPEPCVLHRFWEHERDRHGQLVHGRQGWCIDYGPEAEDAEPLHRLEAHIIRPGEYVSVHEHDGLVMQFRVVSVR